MSMIQLPPGMTPEEYFATPEGRRVQAQNERFAQDTARRHAAARRSPPSAGAAQPKQDPYASSTKSKGVDDIAKEIEEALAEMAPELDPSQRRLMAADLAREYRQQQAEIVSSMTRKPAPEAPDAGREWKWDGNKYEYTDTPDYQARDSARRASAQASFDAQERGRQRMRQNMERASREMGLQAERENRKKTGKSGPLMQEDLESRIGRQNMAAQFKAYTSGQSKAAPPGMAQPKQPQGQGTPLGQGGGFQPPDPQQLYWESVQAGMSPKEAQQRVTEMVGYASGHLRTGPVAPSWTAKYPST